MSTKVITGKLKQSHHCTKRAAFCAASMSRLPAWIIGWLATMPTGRPSRRPSAVIMLGAYAARSSRNESWSRTSLMTVRTSYEAIARAGTTAAAREQSRSTGSSAVSTGGSSRWLDGRYPSRKRATSSASSSLATTIVATPLSRSCTAAPPRRSRPIATPVNDTTTSGPLTYANASLVMITWSAMPSSNAGPDTAGPTSSRMIGTTPEASTIARATRPSACSAAMPSLTSAPELATRPTIGIPSSMARRTARSIASPSALPIAPRCLPPSRLNQLTWRPSRSRRQASTAVLRCPKTGVRSEGGITPPARG